MLAVVLAAMGAVVLQLRCVDAATEAARLGARGDSDGARRAAARLLPDGAEVVLEARGDDVVARVRAAPLGSALPALRVGAEAVAAREPSPVAPVEGPDPLPGEPPEADAAAPEAADPAPGPRRDGVGLRGRHPRRCAVSGAVGGREPLDAGYATVFAAAAVGVLVLPAGPRAAGRGRGARPPPRRDRGRPRARWPGRARPSAGPMWPARGPPRSLSATVRGSSACSVEGWTVIVVTARSCGCMPSVSGDASGRARAGPVASGGAPSGVLAVSGA